MGRFRFSLETLLQIRASQETAAAQGLAQANQEQDRLQRDLDQILADGRALNDSLAEGGVAASISIALRPGLRLNAERARNALAQMRRVADVLGAYEAPPRVPDALVPEPEAVARRQ
mgnify:CR=1 FL=1